ncbi:hypothetical protein [Desulfonema magnum]|uniref:Dockerin domain-containing protein n=1 Tax=Desulfonema magnum TaxID=45655 RepID=A0A975BGY2_9BACT|nr:hypothetical protein [Desulfonema magnum]QTA85098.1 dockerin domain-containing protein [Desulfonema magnum]
MRKSPFDLRVKSGAVAGETVPLTGTVSYDTDGDGINDITRTTNEPGDAAKESVTELVVDGCADGDTDTDGFADMRDVMRILRMLTGTDVGAMCSNADTNADGKVGTDEVTAILRNISN